MKRRHILILYLVLLTVTIGTAAVLVVTGEVSFGENSGDMASGDNTATDEDRTESEREEPPPPIEEVPFDGPRLYLILDDAGHSIDQVQWFIDFPGVLTLAVLPGLAHSEEAARMAIAAGHSVILHQPMEALGGQDPGPGAIYVSDQEQKIRQTLKQNIESIPGIAGINNHMGSKATGDRRTMEIVADELAERKLFFLDSRTTADTVAVEVGRTAGIAVESRDVFLDNVHRRDAIDEQLNQALAIAKEKGRAVMIGHVTVPELAAVLTERYDEIIAAGFRFFPLEDLYTTSGSES